MNGSLSDLEKDQNIFWNLILYRQTYIDYVDKWQMISLFKWLI